MTHAYRNPVVKKPCGRCNWGIAPQYEGEWFCIQHDHEVNEFGTCESWKLRPLKGAVIGKAKKQ